VNHDENNAMHITEPEFSRSECDFVAVRDDEINSVHKRATAGKSRCFVGQYMTEKGQKIQKTDCEYNGLGSFSSCLSR